MRVSKIAYDLNVRLIPWQNHWKRLCKGYDAITSDVQIEHIEKTEKLQDDVAQNHLFTLKIFKIDSQIVGQVIPILDGDDLKCTDTLARK